MDEMDEVVEVVVDAHTIIRYHVTGEFPADYTITIYIGFLCVLFSI